METGGSRAILPAHRAPGSVPRALPRGSPLFAGVLGHELQVARLSRAAGRGEPHHAYLFTGPEGVGRHRVALGLAQALNCDSADGSACGACSACRRIAGGVHPDVWTVEPEPREKDETRKKDTISVDQVRELQRRVGYKLGEARQRVVVVDPADRLHESAANALLKTLEEPPPRTTFTLIARSPSSVLRTIRSRCQLVRLGALPEATVAAWLVASGVPEDRALLRARLGAGSLGRAAALSDEALAERRTLVWGYVDALRGNDRARLAFAEGFDRDPERALAFFWALAGMARDVAVGREAGDRAPLHADCPDLLDALDAALPGDEVFRCIDRIASARARLAFNASPRGLIEEMVLPA